MNELIGYYKNNGERLESIVGSDYIQMKLLGSHAKDKNANVLISTKSFPLITNFKWYLGKDGYPTTYRSIDNKIKFGRGMKMHRLLYKSTYGINDKKIVIDHINRNRLDNRLSNLRPCTQKQNSYNTSKPKGRKYKGVKKGKNDTWTAYANKDGETYKIDNIKSEKEAAKIYDLMAEDLFGAFAGKNFS